MSRLLEEWSCSEIKDGCYSTLLRFMLQIGVSVVCSDALLLHSLWLMTHLLQEVITLSVRDRIL